MRRVLEELCTRTDCERDGTHWHPFSKASLLCGDDGEYTITVRIRTVRPSRKKRGK